MRIIKLKLASKEGGDIYINVEHIGAFYEEEGYSRIGVTTHNNGGFKVKEPIKEILKMIHNSRAI